MPRLPDRARLCTAAAVAVGLAALALGLVRLAPAALAQDASELTLGGISVDADAFPQMALTVDVVRADTQPELGLLRENFELFENGTAVQPFTVTSTETATAHIAVAIAFDTSGSVEGFRLQQAKQALSEFLTTLRPIDEVALIPFASTIGVVVDPTTDREAIEQAVAALRAGGATSLYDAVLRAIDTISGTQNARQIVLVFSDGQNDPVQEERVPGVLQAAEDSGIAVYSIALGAAAPTSFLGQLAERTGGALVQVAAAGDLPREFTAIGNRLRSAYRIEWESGAPADGEPSTIELVVRRDATEIRGGATFTNGRLSPTVTVTGLPPDALTQTTTLRFSVAGRPADPIASLIATFPDGAVAPVDLTDPRLTIDPFDFPPGPLVIEVTATDVHGNASAPHSARLEIAAVPPQLLAPLLSDDPSGTVTLEPQFRAQMPVASVAYFLDGTLLETVSDPPFAYDLNVDALDEGEHALSLRVTDAAANEFLLEEPFTLGAAAPPAPAPAPAPTPAPAPAPAPVQQPPAPAAEERDLVPVAAGAVLVSLGLGVLLLLIRRWRGKSKAPKKARRPVRPRKERPDPEAPVFIDVQVGQELGPRHVRLPARIGRSALVEVVLDEPGILRVHAVLEIGPDGLQIRHLGRDERRTPLVNGSPVAYAPVGPDDEIRIGEAHLWATLAEEAPAEPESPLGHPEPAEGTP